MIVIFRNLITFFELTLQILNLLDLPKIKFYLWSTKKSFQIVFKTFTPKFEKVIKVTNFHSPYEIRSKFFPIQDNKSNF